MVVYDCLQEDLCCMIQLAAGSDQSSLINVIIDDRLKAVHIVWTIDMARDRIVLMLINCSMLWIITVHWSSGNHQKGHLHLCILLLNSIIIIIMKTILILINRSKANCSTCTGPEMVLYRMFNIDQLFLNSPHHSYLEQFGNIVWADDVT
jgi:hypothetical protein